MTEISFPGLGIGAFTVNDTAFTLFGLDIKWYGVIICAGMILAYIYAWTRARYEGIKTDDLLDIALFLLIFSIIGARLYYVAFTFDSYIATGGSFLENLWNTLVNIFSLRNGGLAIFGGIIFGFFTAYFVAKKKKIRFPVLLDVLAPAVMIGQLVGRWGNFMNGEAYGSETTLPWRMGISSQVAGDFWTPYKEVHPTFLYESLWNLLGFVIAAAFYKKKKFNGQIFYFYMIWYGLGRTFIEGLRTDSLLIAGNENLRVSQILAAVVCIVGIALMTVGCIKAAEKKKAAVPAADAEAEPAPEAVTVCENTDEATVSEAEAETETEPDEEKAEDE